MCSDAFRWAVMGMTALFCPLGRLYRAAIRVVMIVGAVNNTPDERSHNYSSYNDFLDPFCKRTPCDGSARRSSRPQASGSDRIIRCMAHVIHGRKRLIILDLVVYEQHALRSFFRHMSRLPGCNPRVDLLSDKCRVYAPIALSRTLACFSCDPVAVFIVRQRRLRRPAPVVL
ncbi:hypothetical protein EDB83DRAFT_2344202 [Lactarius deliciosus]|nr:hypothetical protein EDB83DRAFT_2344202 [Lactarius deliciosus]